MSVARSVLIDAHDSVLLRSLGRSRNRKVKTIRTLAIALALVAVVLAIATGCNNEPSQTNGAPTDSSSSGGVSSDQDNPVDTDSSVVANEVGGAQLATIVIDGGVYSPASVTVKKGVPVELTFKAGENPGCGSTVVFKSLNVTGEVGSKPVVIKFTPKEAGTIAFTCGMGMYSGEVVVK